MNHIIIFIKNPVLGKVKTRLAATLGDQKALKIYQRLLNETLESVSDVEAKYHVFYSDFIDYNDEWNEIVFHKYLQQGVDLGERMSAAFQDIFLEYDDGDPNHIVVIGSDCPTLSPAIMDMAFSILENTDVVIGPTFDGGYYLIGMKAYHADLFKGISWSTDKVYQETKDVARRLNLQIGELPTLNDIDDEEDWTNAILENPRLSF